MMFSSSPRLVYLTLFLLACLALPTDAALHVYRLLGNGLKGDAVGNPDPYVRVSIRSSLVGQTHVLKRTSNPIWNSLLSVSWAKLNDPLKLEVWDEDAKTDDLLGVCYTNLKRGVYTYKCNLAKGGSLTYTYEFK